MSTRALHCMIYLHRDPRVLAHRVLAEHLKQLGEYRYTSNGIGNDSGLLLVIEYMYSQSKDSGLCNQGDGINVCPT